MKKKFLLVSLLPFMLASCALNDNPKGTDNPDGSGTVEEGVRELVEEAEEILEGTVDDVIHDSSSRLLREGAREYLAEEKAYLNEITTLAEAECALDDLREHEGIYLEDVYKPLFHRALNEELVPIINSIVDDNRRNSCFAMYGEYVARNEIEEASLIAAVHYIYEDFYGMVKEHMGIDDPTIDDDILEYIEAAVKTLGWYYEDLAHQIGYEDVALNLRDYYKDQLDYLYEARTYDDVCRITDEIKERMMTEAHQMSKDAAIGDLTNAFEEYKDWFKKKEILDIIDKIEKHLMSSLISSLDSGIGLDEYWYIVDNYKCEIADFLWYNDIEEYYIADLAVIKNEYLEKESSEEYKDRINVLFEQCSQEIKNLSVFEDYEEDALEIINTFETMAKRILGDYQDL